ncbi:MAG: TdeIII family type II restriction endonuclease [Elusimicrobia bacterium]|nr:TdeIII family type II restriction endonuclease [Elusimicrobiota bacterium]
MKKEIPELIKDVVSSMMELVLDKVLYKDPFLFEKWKADKPLYAALVPKEIFKGSHFERRFVTPFGRVWEKLAQIVANNFLGNASLDYSINGTVPEERLKRISEVLNKLEHKGTDKKRTKPDWDNELQYILDGKGELIPTTVICNVFAEDIANKKRYVFEIKTPLPNSDITKVSKEKIFKLYSMNPCLVNGAFFALPYNPYSKRENYNWTFPARWFNMKEDKVVLIGDELWNFIGGENTYQLFISEINKLGKNYRERIYREFLGIEPPKSDSEIII